MAVMMIASLSSIAQVPTVMMYQVQVKHGKASPQDVTIEMQLRKSQTGSAIFSQTFNLTEVKNGSVQNLGLELGSQVNWNDGEYWLATIIDGEEMGCARLTSVPYAYMAKSVEGAPTPEDLFGTWEVTKTLNSATEECSCTFNVDGTFTYNYSITWYDGVGETTTCSGIWKVNSTGNLYLKGIGLNSHEGSIEEDTVIPIYIDRVNDCLCIGDGSKYIGCMTYAKKK